MRLHFFWPARALFFFVKHRAEVSDVYAWVTRSGAARRPEPRPLEGKQQQERERAGAKSAERKKKVAAFVPLPLSPRFLLARALFSPFSNARHGEFEVLYSKLGRPEEEKGQKGYAHAQMNRHTQSLIQQVFYFPPVACASASLIDQRTTQLKKNALPAWLHAEAPLPDQGHGDRRLP